MESLEADVAETLSLLEALFLPSFFDIMVHLMVHLPAQARIAGPVHFRSMWPVERFLMRLKGSVHTKSHPEGSIMEWSMFTECLTFCSRYLHETQFSRQFRDDEDNSITPFFRSLGRGLAGKCIVSLDHKTWLQAHRYVLFNYANIGSYLDKHAHYLSSIGLRNKRDINRTQHESFHEWFRLHVEERCEEEPEEIKILAKAPMMSAHKYSSYTINGFNFHTESYDEGRSVQNSGVALVAESTSFDRGNNDNTIIGNKPYYGIIKEILELNYHHKGNVVLFKCDWVDNRVQDKWVKTDQFGITSVNFKHLFNTGEKLSDEPFILASQAIQVYYVPDPIDKEWAAVVQSKPRDVYDFDNLEDEHIDNDNGLVVQLSDLNASVTVDIVNGTIPTIRTDIDGTLVDPKKTKK
ncbi:uncharacterized protein LOC120644118 [Panicum virgatum]|uniref:uncharacterized protein LOC120644118 n=1 Tax=Panicum virgatum TaxID=38727 RepID=UPI0019D588D8|nr:uncharacterized protein LOC120644118 [Panicum virgatum]